MENHKRAIIDQRLITTLNPLKRFDFGIASKRKLKSKLTCFWYLATNCRNLTIGIKKSATRVIEIKE